MFDGKGLRKKLQAGCTCLGTFIYSTDPCETELLCGSGFDFLIIDSEHTAAGIETVQQHIMATKGTGVAAIVRVPWNDPVRIKPVLDAGADGILVPLIKTAEHARQAVEACLYPPLGVRGWGPRRPNNYEREDVKSYVQQAHENLVVWVQIEHEDALRNVDEIVRTPRLDGVFVGPADLSASLGVLGEPEHPKLLQAIERVISAGQAAAMPVGLAGSSDPQSAIEWLGKGLQFITLATASALLAQAADSAVSRIR